MTASTLNLQQMSSFTRGLYDYERKYLKDASQDLSFVGKVKINLVGRALTLGVSLFLHAEAVCRAVYICFLSIREIFSRSNEDLLKKQRQECSSAYDVSLKSFFAFFHQKILANLAEPQPQSKPPAKPHQVIVEQQVPAQQAPLPQVEAPAQLNQQPVLIAAPLPEQHLLQQLPQAMPVQQIDQQLVIHDQHFDPLLVDEEFEEVDAPIHPVQAALLVQPLEQPQGQAIDEFEEVDAPVNPLQAALQQPPVPQQVQAIDEFEEVDAPVHPVQVALLVQPSQQRQPEEDDDFGFELVGEVQDPLQAALNAPPQMLPVLNDQAAEVLVLLGEPEPPVLQGLAQQQVAPVLAAVLQAHPREPAAVHPLQQPQVQIREVEEPIVPTAHEEAMIEEARQRAEMRSKGFEDEFRLRKQLEVAHSMALDLSDAQAQITEPNRDVPYQVGLVEHYQDAKWAFSKGHLGNLEVGICHYSSSPRNLKAEHLATTLNVTIAEKEYPVQLFAIFDPMIGPRAASYLFKNLPRALVNYLVDLNKEGLTQVGAWNAISLTFLKLNRDFIVQNKKEKVHPLLDNVIADHGTSATVAIILDGVLWTAHLGNSRAVLDNGGAVVQLSEDPSPRLPKYREKVLQLGGTVDESGLVNGKVDMATAFGLFSLKGAVSSKPCITMSPIERISENSHLLIGTYGIFRLTSTRKIVALLHAKQNLEAQNLAHDCIFSIYKENQRSASQAVRERSLSCLVVKINSDSEWEMP